MIIPCFKARTYLARCLNSLARQSLDRSQFEAVLIMNGPDDGSAVLAAEILEREQIPHQIIHSEPGAGRARNAGVAVARAPMLTFLDVDDELSEHYLEALVSASSDPAVVPLAGVEEVTYDGVVTQWWANHRMGRTAGVVSARELYPHLSINAGKLLSSDLMKRYPFDTDLRSGEDVALYCNLFQREGLRVTTEPMRQGAMYRRHLTRSSVSRQNSTFDFMVRQRLAVIARLNAQECPGSELEEVRRSFIASQGNFIIRYLRQNPGEQQRIHDEIRLGDYPLLTASLRPEQPRQAIISEFGPPSATSEVRALARWMLPESGPWHAISSSARLHPDLVFAAIGALLVARHDSIPLPPDHDSAEAVPAFVVPAMAALVELGADGLGRVVTHGQWPVSHLVGALFKRQTGFRWEARLDGPLRQLSDDGMAALASQCTSLDLVGIPSSLDHLIDAEADAVWRAPSDLTA